MRHASRQVRRMAKDDCEWPRSGAADVRLSTLSWVFWVCCRINEEKGVGPTGIPRIFTPELGCQGMFVMWCRGLSEEKESSHVWSIFGPQIVDFVRLRRIPIASP